MKCITKKKENLISVRFFQHLFFTAKLRKCFKILWPSLCFGQLNVCRVSIIGYRSVEHKKRFKHHVVVKPPNAYWRSLSRGNFIFFFHSKRHVFVWALQFTFFPLKPLSIYLISVNTHIELHLCVFYMQFRRSHFMSTLRVHSILVALASWKKK